MKTKLVCLLFLGFIVASSCSSSDNPSSNSSATSTAYFPLKTNNYWTYDVMNYDSSGALVAPNGRDSLYVGNDTIINSISYKKMKTLMLPTGFFSTSLRNNGARVDGSSIKVTGSLSISNGLPTPLTFAIDDLAILKEGATVGEEIGANSGSFSQTINGLPLTFNYTLKSYGNGNLATYTSNGVTYTDLTKTKVVINMQISTSIQGFPFTLMNSQDVLISTQYYAKNKGMVYNKTNIQYQLNSLPPTITLPIPTFGSQSQEEFLHTYLIN